MKTNAELNALLKQRPPFQMVDKMLEIIPGKRGTGIKCVSSNEWYFMGHFPEMSIMPGVLIMEAFAQTCSVVMASCESMDTDKIPMIVKVNSFKFLKYVCPGDVLKIQVKKKNNSSIMAYFYGEIYIETELVAKGEITFSLVDAN